jgi:hypothetical protein
VPVNLIFATCSLSFCSQNNYLTGAQAMAASSFSHSLVSFLDTPPSSSMA